jgi:hypothetical protein
MVGGVWVGSRLDFDELVTRSIETAPQLADRRFLGGMHELRRESGERAQHKSTLQQVRTRQL